MYINFAHHAKFSSQSALNSHTHRARVALRQGRWLDRRNQPDTDTSPSLPADSSAQENTEEKGVCVCTKRLSVSVYRGLAAVCAYIQKGGGGQQSVCL
ncbi:hypothetical protein FKM82_006941 [Ascaphus truei]